MSVILCITVDRFVYLINKCYPIISSFAILTIVGMLFYALFGKRRNEFTIGVRKEVVIWVTMVCSFIALCRTFPTDTLDLDYMGIIVAIFSLIVTILLGWNIYQIIDVKSIRKDFEKWGIDTKKEIEKETEKYIEIEIQKYLIQEETTFCNSYVSAKEWNKVLPLFNNMVLRYDKIAKLTGDSDVSGFTRFVSSVAYVIDEIYKDTEAFKKLYTQISGFIELFNQLFGEHDKNVSKLYDETQEKIRKTT